MDEKNLTYTEFQQFLAFAVSLPKGNVREAGKWMRKVEAGPTKDDKRALANQFIKRHKPSKENIKEIIDYVESL